MHIYVIYTITEEICFVKRIYEKFMESHSSSVMCTESGNTSLYDLELKYIYDKKADLLLEEK